MSVLQLAHHCPNWNSVNILDTFWEEYLSQRSDKQMVLMSDKKDR